MAKEAPLQRAACGHNARADPGFCATRSQGVVNEQPGTSGRAWECGTGRSGGRMRGGAQGYAQQLRDGRESDSGREK